MQRFQTQPSIYRDFIVLTILIIFVSLLAVLWIGYQSYEEHGEYISTALENHSLKIDRALIVELEAATYLLESVAERIRRADYRNPDVIKDILRNTADASQMREQQLFWIDDAQHIVTSSLEGTTSREIDVSDRGYMKRAILSPWKVHMNVAVTGRLTNRQVIPFSIGLTDTANRFIGAAVLSLNLEALIERINQSVAENDHIYHGITTTAYTKLIADTDYATFYDDHFSIRQLLEMKISEQEGGYYDRPDFWNTLTMHRRYDHSSMYPLILLTGYDIDAANDRFFDILHPRLTQIAVAAALLLAILWIMRQYVLYPVALLTDHTQSLLDNETAEADWKIVGAAEIENLLVNVRKLSDYLSERRRVQRELQHKISELQKIKESARITSKVKAEFFREVGRELEAPITHVQSFTEAALTELVEGKNTSESLRELLSEIHHQTNLTLHLIKDIKALSEAENALMSLNESSVDIDFIIQKAVRSFHETRGFQNIQVIADMDESLPPVLADEPHLHQLFLSLMTNAAIDMTSQQVIRLSAEINKQGSMLIHFNYTARNIPVPTIQHAGQDIFHETAGLGMALSRLLVAIHEGRIDIRREHETAHITITFPKSRIVAKAD